MSELRIRPLAPEEYALASDFLRQLGPGIRRGALANWARLSDRPGHQTEDLRAAYYRGEMVALARIEARTLLYGGARLRVALIGDVLTLPHARRRGFAAALLRDALTIIAERGAHLALLDGIPAYFERFGFSPVWPRYRLTVPASALQQLGPAQDIRLAEDRDLPQIAALYHSSWGGRISLQRAPALWGWRLRQKQFPAWVVVESGRVTAYLWQGSADPEQVEAVAETPHAAFQLLAHAATLLPPDQEMLSWPVPPDDNMIVFLRRQLPLRLEADYSPTGGWMARLIDSSALTTALMPEIIAQARSAHHDFEPEALVLDPQPDGMRIGLQNYPQSFCTLSQLDTIQVLFGSLAPATLGLTAQLSPQSIALLERIFPPRVAAIAPLDWP